MEDMKARSQKMKSNIRDNYSQIEKSIVEQLFMKHDLHGTTIGTQREVIWEQLFEMILPKKFVIAHSVFIIDSQANVSKEVDLAIMDEMYTPYIFRYGEIKFVPIEAVAAVVECKSQDCDGDQLITWVSFIKELRTSDKSVARLANFVAFSSVETQKSTRPICILCTMDTGVASKVIDECDSDSGFDFVLLAVQGKKDKKKNQPAHIRLYQNKKLDTLFDWYEDLNLYQCDKKGAEHINACKKVGEEGINKLKSMKLNEYHVTDKNKNISLMTFNFQLNQLLMLINNPMLFPHQEYARMFREEET